MKLNIKFLEPFHRISGKEVRSKLINSESDLYQFLENYRNNLYSYSGHLVSEKRMDFHIELLHRYQRNDIENYLKRVNQLENNEIDVSDISNYGFLGNAFVLFTPYIEGYGKTHITIAHFKGKPADIYNAIKLNPFYQKQNKIITLDYSK